MESNDSGMPKFTLPEGVEIPENLKEGEAFQTMATIVLGAGGKAEVVEIDGIAIPGYENKSRGRKLAERGEEDEEVAPGGGGFIAEVMGRG